jgi:DNA-binding NarL/FixJ family response regulator
MKQIRIVLVDDHSIVRLGVTTLLSDQPDLLVVGEASTAAEAVAAVSHLDPDVVLMDIRLPGEGGIESTRQITRLYPRTKVVMLTSFADEELIVRAINAGAVGYMLKQVGNDELIRAIRAAARGESVLDPSTTSKLLSHVREAERKAEEDAFRDLSDREMDVLVYVAKGKTNGEIGVTLNLSEKTVGNYVSTILEKLRMTNRVELATYAVQHHLFERMGKE